MLSMIHLDVANFDLDMHFAYQLFVICIFLNLQFGLDSF
jgi:hypothetical protein